MKSAFSIMALAFSLVVGITMIILACALVDHKAWCIFGIVPLVMLPLPPIFCGGFDSEDDYSGGMPTDGIAYIDWKGLGEFFMGIIGISVFAVYFILVRVDKISLGAMGLCMGANMVLILGGITYSQLKKNDDIGF